MMKKQTAVALMLLLLIPVVSTLGGFLASSIDPDAAAGHPNYARNYHYLSLARNLTFRSTMLLIAILWLLACIYVIRSKKRSMRWLLLAALGPFGFAILVMLRDKAPTATDRHERFVRGLNPFVWTAYQLCIFVAIWMLAFQAVDLKRYLMIRYEAASTGMPVTQIIDVRDASGGMWAFAEGNEAMYLVALLYLIWPIGFNAVAHVAARKAQ